MILGNCNNSRASTETDQLTNVDLLVTGKFYRILRVSSFKLVSQKLFVVFILKCSELIFHRSFINLLVVTYNLCIMIHMKTKLQKIKVERNNKVPSDERNTNKYQDLKNNLSQIRNFYMFCNYVFYLPSLIKNTHFCSKVLMLNKMMFLS